MRPRFVSTRDAAHEVALHEAVRRGLAPDGGLYVPTALPPADPDALAAAPSPAALATTLLRPFFEGDPLAPHLEAICAEAFAFPLPVVPLAERTAVLELFHGPTAAFKDVGARFLAAALTRLPPEDGRTLTILVATSGDTGGAVAAAFHGRPGVEVVVLFPAGRVSPRQETQLTAWGGNVRALAVRGDFDDCQRLVKAAFADEALRRSRRLSSANSINLGRLLPQAAYHAWGAVEYARRHGAAPGVIVPTGNAGNVLAALWAMRMGAPIREVVMALNANRALPDFLAGAAWGARPTVATLASAMDVGHPSNVERAFHLLGGEAAARAALRGETVTDDEIRDAIRRGPARWGQVWDPHTATAVVARERRATGDWLLVATAHPAKFEGVVEPLVGRTVEVPPALAEILARPSHADAIAPTLDALRRTLAG